MSRFNFRTQTPTGGRFRGGRVRVRPARSTRSRTDLCIYLWRLRTYGPCARFLRGTAGEGGYYNQPVVMYRARRFAGWNKRVGTMWPILRFQWRD
jgi:hypothetical protein